MLLNSRTTRLLLEAADEVGLPRASLIEPLGLVEADLVDVDVKVEWNTVALMCEQVSRLVNGDVERLREVGRRMSRVPAYEPFRRLAGSLLTVRALYDVANRYAAPANFPHLRLEAEFTRDGRMRLHGDIPASYAPSAAFLHITSGSVSQLPVLLGLPPSKILECRVTPRTLDLVIELPQSRSVLERVRRGARAILLAPRAIGVLDEQHRELASNIEALRLARDELRALLDRLPDLVVVHAGGKILWANGAFLSALSYDADHIVGRPFADVIAGRPAALFDEPTAAPGASRVPVLVEVTLRTGTGAHVIVEVAPPQKVVFDGVPAQLVVGRDVTDRKRMQESLIIADRLASVGLLAAGVAHEVNNPLAYVLNNIEIARRELAGLGAGADVSRQALSVALEGVDRIRTIVRDLLVLARGHEEPLRPVDVHAVVESTLALAAYDISRTTNLVQDLRPAPLVLASDGRIAQVLLNLVTNALEAMRDRPRESNELVVRVSSTHDSRLLLEVVDSGRGIAADDLPRLFEPFFTTKPMGKGTGLGLSIAQRLVTELGGEIEVSSVLGSGTTFRVILPSVPEPTERSGAGEPQESSHA